MTGFCLELPSSKSTPVSAPPAPLGFPTQGSSSRNTHIGLVSRKALKGTRQLFPAAGPELTKFNRRGIPGLLFWGLFIPHGKTSQKPRLKDLEDVILRLGQTNNFKASW